jgi:hypothetical protein
VNIEFPTVAVIAPDPSASRELYVGVLGLPLEGRGEGYHQSEQIAGCKSFGIGVRRLPGCNRRRAIVGISYIPMFHAES